MESAAIRNARHMSSVLVSAALAFSAFAAPALLAPQQALATPSAKQVKTEAQKVVKKAKATKGSTAKKLSKAFRYIEKHYPDGMVASGTYANYADPYTITQKNGWRTVALNAFKNKKTNCYGAASAYAAVAKTISKKTAVRIAYGDANTRALTYLSNTKASQAQGHAWAEVKLGKTWYVYDVYGDRNAQKNGKKKAGTWEKKKLSSYTKHMKTKKVRRIAVKL